MLSDKCEMNELDKIISYHQNDKFEPKFLIIEDLKNKCWIVYNGENGMYKEMEFGSYTVFTINEFINYSPNAMRHNQLFSSANADFLDPKIAERIYEQGKEAMEALLNILAELPDWKKWADPEQLKEIMLGRWYYYRYACYGRTWSDFVGMSFKTLEEWKKYFFEKSYRFSEKELEEMYEANKEEAEEHFKTMHEVVRKYSVVYYDEFEFIDEKNQRRFGRSFLVDEETHMFIWDLYHILVSGVTDSPHICPRCKQLFFSNNNKIIYCKECKAESNTIRNEKRMNSVRYIHKKIYDKINNSKFYTEDDRNKFLVESNYYWDLVRKKKVVKNPLFNEKIETEEQYRKWLEKKLKSY